MIYLAGKTDIERFCLLKFFYRRFFMSRSQKMLGVLLACVIACAALLGWVLAQDRVSVNAEEKADFTLEIPIEIDADSADRAGGAYLSLTIGGTGNGFVWAQIENIATIIPSTLWVYIELYSSTTYQESYTSMTLEYRETNHNLGHGERLGISASTNGQQKYWQARARYKIDTADWASMTTSTLLYDANGNCIEWN